MPPVAGAIKEKDIPPLKGNCALVRAQGMSPVFNLGHPPQVYACCSPQRGIQRSMAVQFFKGIFKGVKINSATLPGTIKLEGLIHSGYSGNFQDLEDAYKAVFGDLPTEEEASPELRNMIDATTAASLSSLKTVALITTGGDEIQG